MEETKTFKETIKEKYEKAKNDVYTKVWYPAKTWMTDHKEGIAIFGPVIIGGAVEVMKTVAKSKNVREEKHLKEDYVYDRKSGHYYELRRQPKSSEWRMIDQRKENGELLGDILNDMRLLK